MQIKGIVWLYLWVYILGVRSGSEDSGIIRNLPMQFFRVIFSLQVYRPRYSVLVSLLGSLDRYEILDVLGQEWFLYLLLYVYTRKVFSSFSSFSLEDNFCLPLEVPLSACTLVRKATFHDEFMSLLYYEVSNNFSHWPSKMQ